MLGLSRGDELQLPQLGQGFQGRGGQEVTVVGRGLGAYVALQLAARGRATSVVALAPAGGWATGDDTYRDTRSYLVSMQEQLQAAGIAQADISASNGIVHVIKAVLIPAS